MNYTKIKQSKKHLLGDDVRWRAVRHGTFYIIDENGNPEEQVELYARSDDSLWSEGNYFLTKEKAREYSYNIKKIFKEFHKNNIVYEHLICDGFFGTIIKESKEYHKEHITSNPRYRADINHIYYYIRPNGNIDCNLDNRDIKDEMLWEYGNYFETKEEATLASLKVNKLFMGK